MLLNKLIEKSLFLGLFLFSVSVFAYTNQHYQLLSCTGDECKIPMHMNSSSMNDMQSIMKAAKKMRTSMPAEKQFRIKPLSDKDVQKAIKFYKGLRKCKKASYQFPNPVANMKPDILTNVIHGYENGKCSVIWESFGGNLNCKFSSKTLKLLTSKKALKELKTEMASGKYENAANTSLATAMQKECIFVPNQ